MTDELFAAGFMDDYFAECDEHLAAIRRILLDLGEAGEGRALPRAVVEELFRSFHSIKGISGMVGLEAAERLAHEMESFLRPLRSDEARLSGGALDTLAAGIDALERVIAARRSGQPAPAIDSAVERLDRGMEAAAALPAEGAAAPAADYRITFVPSPARLARGVNVDAVRERLRETGVILDAAPKVVAGGIAFEFLFAGALDAATIERWREDGLTVEALAAAAPVDASSAAVAADVVTQVGPSHVVRVDLTRLDELMRMIGGLVIARARLDEALGRVEGHVPPVEWRAVEESTQAIERQLRDLREGVMRVRLVPIGEILRRVPFVVRDLLRDGGRRVRMDLRGQDTEIDKFLIERMLDPVLHLARNAVSHGFEPADERIAAGKPPEGTLTLAAASIGDAVVLDIADDGRGIDEAAVVARAREMGLTVPDPPLDRARLLDLICTPGFSTRDETDRASGRGVGMAVVKTTVEDLNGHISLETEAGRGTRFRIELPLTLAILDALIAHIGDRTFAVPQAAVREVFELDPALLRRLEGNEIVPFRGATLPVLRLSDVFAVEARPGRALHAFVVGSGPDAVAVAVDRISGQREIVVRSLDDALIKVPGVTGATDLGDGRAVLILDLPGLLRQRGAGPRRAMEAAS
jgi:two-component system chemotaxis sensor kinase CheA